MPLASLNSKLSPPPPPPRSGSPLPVPPLSNCTACRSARCPLKGFTGGCRALAARRKMQKHGQPARCAAPRRAALCCAAQADGQAQSCGGTMGPLPGASRSTGSLSGSSRRWGRRGVGCFQMSGSCSRGWYTDISDPSSLVLLLMHATSLLIMINTLFQAAVDVYYCLLPGSVQSEYSCSARQSFENGRLCTDEPRDAREGRGVERTCAGGAWHWGRAGWPGCPSWARGAGCPCWARSSRWQRGCQRAMRHWTRRRALPAASAPVAWAGRQAAGGA